jgi:ADP-ribose pyrophosphatase YjhB (NUDIX family)
MLPERVAAILIKDKKLLLVTGYEETFYWTPGGKVEGKESHEGCLKRELFAELGIEPTAIKHYVTFTLPNEIKGGEQINYYYLVQYGGEIKLGEEVTKFIWYSKQNFLDKKPRISRGIEEHLIPKLIEDKYL